MAIDIAKLNEPAKKGDVAGVALSAMIALSHARWAFEKQARGEDPAADLEKMKQATDDLNKRFDELTGWSES